MKPEAVAYGKPAEGADVARSKLGDVMTFAKARLNSLVVLTTAGGYYMAAPAEVDPLALTMACLGAGLVAAGAAGMNQVIERDVDALMTRTRERPMPGGRMSVAQGWSLATTLAAVGLVLLWWGANDVAAAVALATLVIYVAAYTPLKRRSSISTLVGAVPGALPPIIGWAAARGSIGGVEPWSLFLIMFVWQLPHFLAISWLCRDDYARAGLPMLASVDAHGGALGRQAALWAASLIPFTQAPRIFGMATPAYAVGALVLGIALFALALSFARHRSIANARRLFYGSIIYLPLLWTLMVLCRR